MGMFGISKSSHDLSQSMFGLSKSSHDLPAPSNPTPDWSRSDILDHLQIGRYLLVRVQYPDCKHYEGHKILLFRDCLIEKLWQQGVIDPHFSENKDFHSPIARFEPTDEGWKMGYWIATIYDEKEKE